MFGQYSEYLELKVVLQQSLRLLCCVSVGLSWVQRSKVMGDSEAVNSGGGLLRRGRYDLAFIYEAAATAGVTVARDDERGVVTSPTGIGSWSRGQRLRGRGGGRVCVCVSVFVGLVGRGGSLRQVGHCCRAATPAPPVNQHPARSVWLQ